jgi:hypothetical protein
MTRRLAPRLATVRMVSDEEAERAAYLVCCRKVDDPGAFDDDLTGHCVSCRSVVIFRPSSPKTPPRLCLQCAAALAGGVN